MTSVVLAGGGTAGHTSPLIATAQVLEELGVQRLVAVGTAKGLETEVIPKAGLKLELIEPVPLPRTVNLDLARLPVRLSRAVRQSLRILRRYNADVVVGFGGYVSIPVYLAARAAKVPVVVHEANNIPGIANKIGARFARYVATTFDTPMRGNPQVIGMPMNRSITRPSHTPEEARESFGLDPRRRTLLVSGGSQGALAVNRAVIGARDALLDAGIQILHVLGPKNYADDPVVTRGGVAYVPVAYVDDMSRAYQAADLMVGRAGAGTVMETAVSGLPVIFIPLPWGNGEQGRNAAALVAAGGGVLLEENRLDEGTLGAQVLELFEGDRLGEMAQIARDFYPSDAAEVLARAVYDIARKG
ncbi:undecaprenyldiphospho-muramoylpentapeptide beta-N-acetylglucosaminyltransferase [Tessaracoccus sp. OH4464_COT-324]|uniref:undecaprenyldiphospho-muramoylpentapeptide beta-N-acetylglucosaminyltransferase n=1 Tax=Tessaracoccus sp. OH4464_COT-324 TaxID=2491059 RepID=UPI000F640C4E|nr:undecaprenyldiphospho-muramoylpentapeptide beta-N-acetylglucosaminyltransferase [Tessaracoccus sp. OH4464_COT-324]RRD47542.1 undecaprenyldiphospho-muramoylpentapeptide beta-N-acetylglucosaminyltransferase [Tessaracoccus sp. OH4464_COT-324]